MVLAETNSVFSQVAVGTIIGLVVVGLPLLIRYLVRLGKGVERIMTVLITPKPTDLVPNPPPGLVETVSKLVMAQTPNLRGTAALIRDSQPDDGSSSRDVLDKIDEATKDANGGE
jgi:hypothetical protein